VSLSVSWLLATRFIHYDISKFSIAAWVIANCAINIKSAGDS